MSLLVRLWMDADFYLQVSVHNAQLVQVVYSVQNLTDQRARILLCVKSFFHNSVKQFSSRNPADEDRKCAVKIHPNVPVCILQAGWAEALWVTISSNL